MTLLDWPTALTPLPEFRLIRLSDMETVMGPPDVPSALIPPPGLLLIRVLSMTTLMGVTVVGAIFMPPALPVMVESWIFTLILVASVCDSPAVLGTTSIPPRLLFMIKQFSIFT